MLAVLEVWLSCKFHDHPIRVPINSSRARNSLMQLKGRESAPEKEGGSQKVKNPSRPPPSLSPPPPIQPTHVLGNNFVSISGFRIHSSIRIGPPGVGICMCMCPHLLVSHSQCFMSQDCKDLCTLPPSLCKALFLSAVTCLSFFPSFLYHK